MDTVVIAIQHDDLAEEKFGGSEREEHTYICSEIMENVIKAVIPASSWTVIQDHHQRYGEIRS